METNLEQAQGYGEDEITSKARDALRGHCEAPDADVYFVSGGTQANAIIISSMLRPYESVLSAHTGHINVHEAGAIEATGHKVDVIQSSDGKLSPEMVATKRKEFHDHHMTKPKMVYISNSTEVGTVYSKEELKNMYEYCQKEGLYLFLDGARLGSAICGSDLTLSDVARYTDIFYIGATKNGGLLGEAIVITREELKTDFLRSIKQRGGLLAKGKVLGAQFLALFEGDLFFDLAKHANAMAKKLSDGIQVLGYDFLAESTSNQIFPIFPKPVIEGLQESFLFYVRQSLDADHDAIRLVTSRATKEDQVDAFLQLLSTLGK